jgi:hypothetical protein
MEKRAADFQAKVLEAAGGSRAEIRDIRSRQPRDFTAGHDGSFALSP